MRCYAFHLGGVHYQRNLYLHEPLVKMYLPSFTHPDKLEAYIERCKAIIDQSLDDYHKAWRTGFPRDKYLTRADYYAGRILKAEKRLEELRK